QPHAFFAVDSDVMPTEFAILGAGAWGTAMALVLAENPRHRVHLWSARPENAMLLHQRRENVRLLPAVPIPPAVILTIDIRGAVASADLLVVAIPTVHLRSTLSLIAPSIPADRPVLSLTKGLEMGTFARPTEVIHQVLGPRALAVLSGPSHAEE